MSDDDQHDQRAQRREAEVALVQAMYPSNVTWHEQRQEMTYRSENGGILTLRTPDNYPGETQPILISAVDQKKNDLRDRFRVHIDALSLPIGDEVVDAIIQAFDEVMNENAEATGISTAMADEGKEEPDEDAGQKTVIVWLHHLLNTNKRKLALNPSIDQSKVAGATKPGYPGILVYSGDAASVDAHVSELRNQRWQAFQVRFETTSRTGWTFSHGSSIKEYESISEVTQSIMSEQNKQDFLKAVGIK